MFLFILSTIYVYDILVQIVLKTAFEVKIDKRMVIKNGSI